MAEKILVMDSDRKSGLDDCKFLQLLVGNVKDESLYSEFQSIDEVSGKPTYDTHELAVSVKDMIKIRDFLTNVINKIAKNYTILANYDGDVVEILEGE